MLWKIVAWGNLVSQTFRFAIITLLFITLKGFIDSPAAVVAMKLIKAPTQEYMFCRQSELEPNWGNFLRTSNLKINVKHMNRIPKTGKLLVIMNDNHPYGWKIAEAVIGRVRKDAKFYPLVRDDWYNDIFARKTTFCEGRTVDMSNAKQSLAQAVIVAPSVASNCTFRGGRSSSSFSEFLRSLPTEVTQVLPIYIRVDHPLWWKVLWWILPRELGKNVLQTFALKLYKNANVDIYCGSVTELSKDVDLSEYEYLINRVIT